MSNLCLYIEGSSNPHDGVDWTVNVTSQRDQSIKGFGAALSNAAASLIYNSTQKNQILNDLFTRNGDGIGISYVRLVRKKVSDGFNVVL